MSEPEAETVPVAAHVRRRRPVQENLIPAPAAPAPRRRAPRIRYAPAPPPVQVSVVWKSGKPESFSAGGIRQDRDFLYLVSYTEQMRLRTVVIARADCRLLVIEEPMQMPSAPPQPSSAQFLPGPAAPAQPESVMHVSPGMRARKADPGRTLVTPDGQTVTRTPEGDIIGAALFAAGMPPGRPGL